KITATTAAGDCLLAPQLNGDVQIIEVGGNTQYRLNDGAFVACSSGVNLTASLQRNLGGALFGDSGGFVVMQTAGQGQLAITGMGVIYAVDIEPGKTTTIDNGHVVCWDANLDYSLSPSVRRSNGLLGSVMNAVTSGEGFILKFTGRGKVYLSSRNRNSYRSWLQSLLGNNR
ncbi:AIM24 family protein, partial [Suttonella ornithocola]